MLVTAVQQLEELSQDNKYREAADMLEAVKQLMTLFNQYSDIPKIRDIQARVKRVREQLSAHIDVVFGSIGRIIDTVADLDAMRELPGETANQLRRLADVSAFPAGLCWRLFCVSDSLYFLFSLVW